MHKAVQMSGQIQDRSTLLREVKRDGFALKYAASYELINDPDYIIRRTYSQNDKPNFAYDAFSNIYLNYFLAPEILDSFPYMSNSHEGLFDNNLTVYITEGYEDFPPNVIFSISGSFNEYQGNNLIYKSAGSQISWIFYEYEY